MCWKLAVAVLFCVSSALAGGLLSPPPTCPAGEVYKACGGCDPGCKEPTPICPKDTCRKGCFCKDGYVRDNNSKCIPREECPRACGFCEIFKTCGTCDKTCTDSNPACTKECKIGCFCLDGHVRNSTGQCIPAQECPPPCKAGEVYKTCGTCDGTCKDGNIPCTDECKVGCFCIDGYVRNDAGDCIPIKDCPPKCKPGEIFKKCKGCDGTCKDPNPVCPLICQPGCACIDGYVRNDDGDCVPIKDCPPKCKPGEIFKKCKGCDGTCKDPNPICTLDCKPGCACIDGYVRNDAGDCIPIKDCPPKCKPGEIFKKCKGCDGTCKDRNPPCPLICLPGCACIDGYVRNDAGDCVPIKDCPPKCGPGEFFTTCGGCDPSCKNPNPICPAVCRVGCFCIKGYVRNNEGKCIPAKDCPRKCKPCEVFSTCGTCDKTCRDRNPPCTRECKVGCFCRKGLVRDDKGQCIPPKDCPTRCKAGEVFRKCGRCDGTCKNPHPSCRRHCRSGCFCRDGWVRNDKGRCVPLKSCRRCPKTHS